jgi:hypothetical protein
VFEEHSNSVTAIFCRKRTHKPHIFLGMTVSNQNYFLEEIKSKLNAGNACYCNHPLTPPLTY